MRPPSQPSRLVVVTDEDVLRSLVEAVRRADRVAVDIEADGMFAYRARPCTVQLGWDGGRQIAVVDVLATPITLLAPLLDADGPVKVVHDVAFDARLLADCGIALGNVHDTAIAARMLSRPATGLAALLDLELGVHIAKTLQHHDWRERPFDEPMLGYLAADVAHLEALEEKLWTAATRGGIEDAILEETRYRIASAHAASKPHGSAPPYSRIKGTARLSERELAALRAVADLRESEASRRDVPPHHVASADALIAIARTRPTSLDAIAHIKGISVSTAEGAAFAATLLVSLASAGDRIPVDERVHFDPPRPSAEDARRRRQRETRLMAWRREEAKRRGVDEQVVLPGHCLKDVADGGIESADDLARVPGIGEFRIRQDGHSIALAVRGQGDEAEA